MKEFFNNIVSGIGINDVLDILVVAFIVYKIIGFIRENRAGQLAKGLLVVVVAAGLSDLLNLYTLNWLLRGALTVGVIALIVIFQPELRRALESLGRKKIFKTPLSEVNNENAMLIVREFVDAMKTMSESKTGALIIIERQTALTDICETGTRIDARITAELIGNIFYEGAPLHDGAVIVRGDRLHSAGCVLPLTQNQELPKELGTRHRAGIGITEISDAISLIVSEETGTISVARDGKIERGFDKKGLEKILIDCYYQTDEDTIIKKAKTAIGKIGGSKDA